MADEKANAAERDRQQQLAAERKALAKAAFEAGFRAAWQVAFGTAHRDQCEKAMADAWTAAAAVPQVAAPAARQLHELLA